MKPLAILAAGLTLASIARADVTVDYTRQIKPILQARCYACHGVLKQKAGLRLDSAALAIKGGKGAATIVPGDAEASVLIDRISSDAFRNRGHSSVDRPGGESPRRRAARTRPARPLGVQEARPPAGSRPRTLRLGEESDRRIHRNRASKARADATRLGR
jgi:hypothetical protein